MSPARTARLLVVCHANVARSVAAARLLETRLSARRFDAEVRTAGTHAPEGQPISMRTRRALERILIEPVDLTSHRSRPLAEDDLAWAQLVVAMEASQVEWIRLRHPAAASRTATLGLLARSLPAGPSSLVARIASLGLEHLVPDEADDVADPAGGDDEAYSTTMRELDQLCLALAGRIAG